MDLIIKFLIAFAVFMVIDLIWLGFIAKNVYQKYLGYIMAKKINWVAAVVFYMLFIMGMLFFVINPAIEAQSVQTALINGAAFGFITYATYDLTNLSTLEGWPIQITIIDLIWGTSLATLVSVISYFIINLVM